MTGSKIFIDTAPFIYFIEGCNSNPVYYEKMKSFFQNATDENCEFFTSAITVEEYLTVPFKTGNEQLEAVFRQTLDIFNIRIIDVNYEVAKSAAKIRAEYLGFKGMDSLQLAVAEATDCDYILTNDKQLKQFRKISIQLVDEL